MSKPKATIDRTINISWDEALIALSEITLKLGYGNHGDLFARNDVQKLRGLASFVEREIDEYEKARKENKER